MNPRYCPGSCPNTRVVEDNYCRNCGKKYDNEDNYCSECGEKRKTQS